MRVRIVKIRLSAPRNDDRIVRVPNSLAAIAPIIDAVIAEVARLDALVASGEVVQWPLDETAYGWRVFDAARSVRYARLAKAEGAS